MKVVTTFIEGIADGERLTRFGKRALEVGSEAGALMQATGLAIATEGRFAAVNVLDYSSTAAPTKVHVPGDASATTQPKAGHIANQEAKVCADALTRIFAGGSPDPPPATNSSCFSTTTMEQMESNGASLMSRSSCKRKSARAP